MGRETTELQWRFSLFFCWQWLPRLPPRQTPRLRLTLTSSTEDMEDMVLATEAMDMVSATDMEVMDTTTAKADPYLLYGGYYGHGLGYGYGLGYGGYYGGYGHYYGKREADPAVVAPVVGYPYAAYPYAAPAVVPATQSITYKTYTLTVETNVVATNAAVPVAVGGYKAVPGDNGELKGAVHEVPAIFGAPALNTQVNDASQGSLTVGTSAVITHTLGEPIVNEHTAVVP